ncbi:MAG TPA: NTP transferase domain-containing protein, partial [Blastocatellia bacterium]|nr:NTP transferase domain-containing protein [Blastocatellia bacterium]
MKSPVNVLILAAGLGTRMKSSQAKVLHKIGSCPLIARSLRVAAELEPENIFVVVGHQAGKVEEAARASLGPADAEKLRFVMQSEQRGTGHAVKCAGDVLKNANGRLVVFYGDTPAVKAETLRKLVAEHERAGNAATLITIRIDPPPAYGRIIRDERGNFLKIVEERDCS